MDPARRNFKNIFFTICTWPNRPVAAKILSGFQFEGKSDVWTSQVRRVKKSLQYQTYLDFRVAFANETSEICILVWAVDYLEN